MKYIAFLCVLLIGIACQEQNDTQKKTDSSIDQNQFLEIDSLRAPYPTDWKIDQDINDAGSRLITIRPKDTLNTGVIGIVIFKAELPLLQTLMSMKGNVYLMLNVETEAIKEEEAGTSMYQGVEAVLQKYQVDLGDSNIEGQFTVFNKSGKCYVLFYQTKNKDKQTNNQVFTMFEQGLAIE